MLDDSLGCDEGGSGSCCHGACGSIGDALVAEVHR